MKGGRRVAAFLVSFMPPVVSGFGVPPSFVDGLDRAMDEEFGRCERDVEAQGAPMACGDDRGGQPAPQAVRRREVQAHEPALASMKDRCPSSHGERVMVTSACGRILPPCRIYGPESNPTVPLYQRNASVRPPPRSRSPNSRARTVAVRLFAMPTPSDGGANQYGGPA